MWRCSTEFSVVTRFEVVLYPPRERSALPQNDAALSALGRLKVEILLEPQATLSASARKRISLAQKARWAKRVTNVQVGTARPKRTMSASARRKIAAAQRTTMGKGPREESALGP